MPSMMGVKLRTPPRGRKNFDVYIPPNGSMVVILLSLLFVRKFFVMLSSYTVWSTAMKFDMVRGIGA